MSKRRTRREKVEAHHQFTISYRPNLGKSLFEPAVKGQIKNGQSSEIIGSRGSKKAEESAQGEGIEFIRRDIVKSLLLVSLILALELVIYLAVHR